MGGFKQAPTEKRKARTQAEITADIEWGADRLKKLREEMEYLADRVHGDMMYLDLVKMKGQKEKEADAPAEAFRAKNEPGTFRIKNLKLKQEKR